MILLLAALACGPSSDDIVGNLSSTNPVVRQDTAKIARNFGSDTVENALISVLDDAESEVRLNAVESLVELEATQAVGALIARLDAEPNARVQRAVVDALGRLGDSSAVPALVALLEARELTDPPLDVIWALGNLEDARALPILSRLRESTDAYVVWNANQALRNLRPAEPAG